MARFFPTLAQAVLVCVAFVPLAAHAAASPAPKPLATDTASSNKDAGTIEGIVISVDMTPAKSNMVVKTDSKTITFAVTAGTSVKDFGGKSGDFAVDVAKGERVSVSASISGGAYTAQIVRVLSTVPPKPVH